MGIISWIILGLIAGFIASKIVDKRGQGFWLDIALGNRRCSRRRIPVRSVRGIGGHRLEHLQHDCRNRGIRRGPPDLQRTGGSPPRLIGHPQTATSERNKSNVEIGRYDPQGSSGWQRRQAADDCSSRLVGLARSFQERRCGARREPSAATEPRRRSWWTTRRFREA